MGSNNEPVGQKGKFLSQRRSKISQVFLCHENREPSRGAARKTDVVTRRKQVNYLFNNIWQMQLSYRSGKNGKGAWSERRIKRKGGGTPEE